MAQALTARTIETLKAGVSRCEVPDHYMPGLYLIVQPSGAKSWAVRYRHHGRPRKVTIGAYPAIDLKTARTLGAKALRAAAEGRDPGQEKAEARASKADSVESVAARFLEQHCRSYRPRSLIETKALLRRYVLPRWQGRPIGSITRGDVRDMLHRIVDGGAPVAANHALSVTRTLFNWCIQNDLIPASPCVGVRPVTVETSRDRILSDDELRRVWAAADEIGPPFGAAVKLLILTGQRRSEVAGMQWPELDLENRLWSLPRERVKNNRAHAVALSPQAMAVIEQLPRIGERFVFTVNGEKAIAGFAKAKRRLDKLSGVENWTLHDLRRSTASGLARIGIALPTIERLLNHVSGSFAGIVGVYQRHRFEPEMRAAVDAWGQFVEALISGTSRKNVVALHGKGRGHA